MWAEVVQQLNNHIEKCLTFAAFILKTSNCFLCYLVFAKFIQLNEAETIKKQKFIKKTCGLNVINKVFVSKFYKISNIQFKDMSQKKKLTNLHMV